LLDRVVEEVVTLVAKNFGDYHVPEFRSASYLQMNAYTDHASSRDLLQDPHEDGHMVTIHYANSPGLEAKIGGEYRPVDLDPDTLLLVPGSILTGLTSGKVPPLYHRVRNHHVVGRGSLMYFVNPSLEQPVYSWSGTGERGEDLREKIRSNPSTFGLPDVPSL
jgi:isopenicillin N synthase-like dioxygenase